MKPIYVWVHGEATRYRRDEKGLHAECADDLPESFVEDAHDYVEVFEGRVIPTRGMDEDALDALGLPSSAASYDEWWDGHMRPATAAELLAVFGIPYEEA